MSADKTNQFAGLDEIQFEEFCVNLLRELGFVNVDWRKGTGLGSSPADQGRDIEAFWPRAEVDDSTYLERWFIECKHHKKGVSPAELHSLLAWAEAERPDVALVIASGFLSNPAKEHLRTYKEHRRPPFRIKYWERYSLSTLQRRAAKPSELILSPVRAADMRLVFSSVPREPGSPFEVQHPEFNYLAGPNEVDFAWRLHPLIQRLVPAGRKLLPVTFSKQMYSEGGTVKTVNPEMWGANLLVSGSTKFNDVTRELHAPESGLGARIVFRPQGGGIVDRQHKRTYRAERSRGEVTADYGILARYPNPYDSSKMVVLVAGAESVYQIGVTNTLLDKVAAGRLLDALERRLGDSLPDYFEALIRAPGRGLEFTGPLEVVEAFAMQT